MNHPQLWRSSGLALTLLMTALSLPAAYGAGHTVRKGDTFTSIARRLNVSISVLQKANPGVKPGVIQKGQVLNIPASGKTKEVAVKTKPQKAKAALVASPEPKKAAPRKNTPESDSRIGSRNREETAARVAAANREPAKGGSAKRGAISTYHVKSGETLTALARRNGLSVGELAEMNGLDNMDLHEGQKLIVPARPGTDVSTASSRPSPAPAKPRSRETHDPENTVDLTPPPGKPRGTPVPVRKPATNPPAAQGTYYHVVKRGDTFSSIARERKVTVAELTRANRNVDPNRLSLNQKIHVPGVQVASRQTAEQTISDDPAAAITSFRPAADADIPPPSAPLDTENPEASDEVEPESTPASQRTVYRVTANDSMDSIAREFNTTAKELRSLNKMGTFDRLHVGHYIQVPWNNDPAGTL